MNWYIFQSKAKGKNGMLTELDVCSERYASDEEADGRLEELFTGSYEYSARWMRLDPNGDVMATSGWQSSIACGTQVKTVAVAENQFFIQARTQLGFFTFSQVQADRTYARERVTAVAMSAEYSAVRWISLDENGDIAEAGNWNGIRLDGPPRPSDYGPYAAAQLIAYKSQIKSLKASRDFLREEVDRYRTHIDNLEKDASRSAVDLERSTTELAIYRRHVTQMLADIVATWKEE